MTSSIAALKPFYEGWARYQSLLMDILSPLTDQQLQQAELADPTETLELS